MQLLYLVHREALASIIPSQVLTPLEEHRSIAKVTVAFMTPIGHLVRGQYRPALRRIEERCRASGIDVGWLPSPPSRTQWLWSDRFVVRQWVLKEFGREQPLIVRCRNAHTTSIALDALHDFPEARVIYDCRGAEVTEAQQMLGVADRPASEWPATTRTSIEQIAAREARAVRSAAGITAVSQALVDRLREKYPEQPAFRFHVIPCCSDVATFTQVADQRDTVRRELGLSEKFVVVYLGSLVWYQLPEASLRVFRLIRQLRSDAHFLAITTEPDKMRSLVQQAGIADADVTIRSVPPRDVPRLLTAADCGLMLRDDTETNRVASPVKFGEYLAAGMPVVISPRLGDCSAIVNEQQLGVEVDLNKADHEMSERLARFVGSSIEATRSRCRQFAEQHLAWPGVIPRLGKWYEELLSSSERGTSVSRANPTV